MVANCFYEVVSVTLVFPPLDFRSTEQRKADSIGCDELLNRADYALRDRPEVYFPLRRRYQDLARLIWRTIEREGDRR